MSSAALPILFAIFVWWFSTGIVLLLDGLPRTTFRWSHLLSSALALGALVGVAHTAGQTTPAGAFCAFTCALLVWGWHELSFLTGWVTGPRRLEASPGAAGWLRFTEAVQTILWHELAILAGGLAIVAITWGQPNQVGTATYLVLWFMRISAKLNVFFGVRNLSLEFLPPHLKYLGSYFRTRPMNRFFPLAVTAASAVACWLVADALGNPPGSARATGSWLVASLLSLGILEHWLLVLPMQATALWQWAMRKPEQSFQSALPVLVASKETGKTAYPVVPALTAVETDDQLLHAR
jgi:putative photosynthetic complex assembly protein 2